MSQTEKSASTFSWVDVQTPSPPSEDHFTRDRPPHINHDNMPSGQVASVSTDNSLPLIPKKLDSNQCSTETPGTDQTQIKGDHVTMTPKMSAPPQDPKPCFPKNIPEWIDDVGLGGKFYRNCAPSEHSSISSRSQLSTSSSTNSKDWAFPLHLSAIDVELAGNGAWCDPTTGPSVPASSSLVLDQD
ncbi:hypothetical protein QBC38DRAFT_31453 [Podospora fimiseda]|uniref:Uncharacterized protein n=1 Tax=Podospora fimiseda TaxID=252190 RepID=A0AAN7BW83_9PEZI|nr:hypothetical protein QBC38DRAFT_31453 [Podospora fimiseda]